MAKADLVPGTTMPRTLMVKKIEEKTTTGGKSFLSGEVFEREGTYSFKVWHPFPFMGVPASGDVLEAEWKVEDFMGKTQLVLSRLLAHHDAKDVEDASAFVRTASITKAEWIRHYEEHVEGLIEDGAIRLLLQKAVLESDRFFLAPAAKGMHHPWRGGLSEHVHRLLCLFLGLCASGHPGIERARKGLVIAGLCLHDWGKALEYEEVAPGQFDVGRWGSLMGHLAGGPIQIARLAEECGIVPYSELWMHLFHVLLAHHGQVEWGSPVTPATIEATIVHHLDNLDGKLSPIEEAKDSEYVRSSKTNVAHFRA